MYAKKESYILFTTFNCIKRTGTYVLTLTGIYMTGTKEVKVLFNQMVKEDEVLFNQMVRNDQDLDQQSFEMVVTYSMTQ